MGNFSYRAFAGGFAVALLTLASTGCHGFVMPGFSTPAPSSRDPIVDDFAPGASLDGSGGLQPLELPTKKKVEACYAAARQMEKAGKLAEAIYYYEQIRELDNKRDLACARHLSILYDRKGDFDRALDEYHKLIAANPKDADAYNDLGYGYYTRGKFEAAEQNLRKAVELDPKNKRAWSNYGMTLAQLGRYPESVAAFEKVVNKAQALCNIGFIQAAQGQWYAARDSYALALQHEPGLQKARAALEAMEEGPKSKRDRNRLEARNGYRDGHREPDPEMSQRLLGSAVGLRGADSDIVVIGDEVPITLPMPGGRPVLPGAAPAETPAATAAAAVPSPASPQPPVPIAPSPGVPDPF